MKTRLTTVMLLIMFFALVTDSVLFEMPTVSSTGSSRSDSVSLVGTVVPPSVEAIKNFGNSINITGDLKVSGNDTLRFAGISPQMRAKVFLNGSIDVVENGTLVLQYVDLYLVGPKTPYSRYIRLLPNSTNGYPQLIVSNATIRAATLASLRVKTENRRPIFENVSVGSIIYAYGDSRISGREFAFYRSRVSTTNITTGGPCTIECYDDSVLDVSTVILESVQVYDNARATIYTGRGARRAVVGSTVYDGGTFFEAHGSSVVNIFSVSFMNTSVLDNAYMSFTYCTELFRSSITIENNARVDLLAGTKTIGATANGPQKRNPNPPFNLIQIYLPGINASGNSVVTLNSSVAISSAMIYPVAYLWDNAVLHVLQNCSVTGRIAANDYSKVFLSNMPGANRLKEVLLESRNFSSISVVNSLIAQGASPPQIQSYDNSSVSLVDSSVQYGYLSFHNYASVRISNSSLINTKVEVHDKVDVRIANGSKVENEIELRDHSRLTLSGSSAMLIFCLNSSYTSLSRASVSALFAKEDSDVTANNSTFTEFSLVASNVTGSWVGYTNFFANSSLPLTGRSPTVSLLNTTVKDLDLLFQGNSNVTIADSTIGSLGLQGSSVVYFRNVSYSSDSVSVLGNAKLFVYSGLRVRVVDYFGNPLSGANVSIEIGYIGSPKSLASQLADANGWTSFVLFSGFSNKTGSFTFGYVTVRSRLGGVTGANAISLTLVNEDVTVSMPLPTWARYILPVVVIVAIVVVLALITFIFRRFRKKTA
jgi:hypothetical protein